MNSPERYELDSQSRAVLHDFVSSTVLAKVLHFQRRREQVLTFTSASLFHRADVQITALSWCETNYATEKYVDLLVHVKFMDVQLYSSGLTDMRGVQRFLNGLPTLEQEMSQSPVLTQGGRTFNRTPISNTINLGQVDTFGDPEILFAGSMKKLGLINHTLKLLHVS